MDTTALALSSTPTVTSTAFSTVDFERSINRTFRLWNSYVVQMMEYPKTSAEHQNFLLQSMESAQKLEQLFHEWRGFAAQGSRKRQRGSSQTSVHEQIASLSIDEKQTQYHEAIRTNNVEMMMELAKHVAK